MVKEGIVEMSKHFLDTLQKTKKKTYGEVSFFMLPKQRNIRYLIFRRL